MRLGRSGCVLDVIVARKLLGHHGWVDTLYEVLRRRVHHRFFPPFPCYTLSTIYIIITPRTRPQPPAPPTPPRARGDDDDDGKDDDRLTRREPIRPLPRIMGMGIRSLPPRHPPVVSRIPPRPRKSVPRPPNRETRRRVHHTRIVREQGTGDTQHRRIEERRRPVPDGDIRRDDTVFQCGILQRPGWQSVQRVRRDVHGAAADFDRRDPVLDIRRK